MKTENKNIGWFIATVSAILFLTVMPVFSGEISLSSKINKTDIAFEDNIDLTVELRWDGSLNNYLFELQPLVETENLIVVGSNRAISSAEDKGQEITTRTFKYTLKPTMSGTGIIHPVIIRYMAMPDSIPGELSTQDYKILIADPIPVEKPSEFPTYLLVITGALVILIIGGLFVMRRKNTKPVEPRKNPEDTFLEELSAIKKESQSDRKLFFTRLHRQLVLFLEAKHGLSISGKTNQVILDEFNKLEIPLDYKEQLSGYISRAEKEKYAPTKGEPGEIIKLCTELEQYFNEIKK
ncbi:MAG: hypothetical protein ABIJ45_06525 [Candidatus Zixiibacteriota bacterium]